MRLNIFQEDLYNPAVIKKIIASVVRGVTVGHVVFTHRYDINSYTVFGSINIKAMIRQLLKSI